MIDTGGLPKHVIDDLVNLDNAHIELKAQVVTLRTEALKVISVAETECQIRQWGRVQELLGLALGYLCAADRIDEMTP